MAIQYLNNIDLNQNELQHAVIENQPSDALAGTGVDGQLYFNTTSDVLKIWKNEGWFKVDDFSIGFSFNTSNGVLTATVSNEADVTVDLDGRYLLPGDIQGTQNEVTVDESEGIVTIGLPDDVTIASQLTVGSLSSTDTPAIISRTSSTGTNLLLESTATGSTDSPDLVLFRNVAPHSSGDYLGSLKFRGNASGGEGEFDYATMSVIMTGADEASIVFDSETVGSSDRTALFAIHGVDDGSVVVNPTSATQIPTHTLDVNGDANISDDLGVGGNLIVTGDLTVSGTTTTVNTETITLADNIITLNNNETGTPSQNGGIEVERGTEDNITLIWNESTDRWTFTNDGTNYHNIPVSDEYDKLASKEADIDVSNTTFIANKRATINHGLNSENVIVQLYDKTTGAVVYADIEHTSDGSTISKNHVRIEFGVVPDNDIRVIMIDAKDAAQAITPSYS